MKTRRIRFGKIKHLGLRRLALVLAYPLMAAWNVMVSPLEALLYLLRRLVRNQVVLFKSAWHTWSHDTPYEIPDEQESGLRSDKIDG